MRGEFKDVSGLQKKFFLTVYEELNDVLVA